MCTSCGGRATSGVSGTASSSSSFKRDTGTWLVYRADGSTKEVDSEAAARMEISKSGGSYRRK